MRGNEEDCSCESSTDNAVCRCVLAWGNVDSGFSAGATPGIIALSLSAGIPAATAFPSLAYIFHQHGKLKDAYLQLERAHVELQARSRIDHMTGLLNREALLKR